MIVQKKLIYSKNDEVKIVLFRTEDIDKEQSQEDDEDTKLAEEVGDTKKPGENDEDKEFVHMEDSQVEKGTSVQKAFLLVFERMAAREGPIPKLILASGYF